MGGHLIFRRTNGGSVVTEYPKGGITETLEGFKGGPLKVQVQVHLFTLIQL